MNTIAPDVAMLEDIHPMILSKLLENVRVTKMFQTLYGRMVVTHDVEVRRIQYDSRKVERGDMFVAIRGAGKDGHTFIASAIENGAKVIIVDDDGAMPDSFFMHAGVVKVVVANTRVALATIAANYFNHPAAKLTMVGVTGTNGKTTTTHLMKSILETHGWKTGLLGTIEYRIGDEIFPATHTTPESLELHELLSTMVNSECRSAVMEVSSHALEQHRVEGIGFQAAAFTNLTQDHLDYHVTMDEYFNAKKMLFEQLHPDSWAIVNVDDEWGKKMIESTKARTISYSALLPADLQAKQISLSMQGTTFTVVHRGEETMIESSLIGRFNVSNILAAFGMGIALGIPKATVRQGIRETHTVRGRFERIVSPKGWTAVIDYAHTPDALHKALMAVHDVFDASQRGRIITVFGCGGNRDRGKRPKMAGIATTASDITIVTSDNPRHEDPELIIDEIMTGVQIGKKVYRESDRAKAIRKGLELAMPGDVILIAGKGHEDYQVIGDKKIHFSDREVVEECIRS